MSPYDAVGADVLVADAGRELVFGPRSPWTAVLVFGSWGAVITLPMMMLAASGEIPARPQALGAAPIFGIGLALCYTALRSFVNRARLERAGGELRLRRGPLWPFRERRWQLSSIAATHVELHPESFRYPAALRGRPMARPSIVVLTLRDGARSALPLALGLSDARAVSAWIDAGAR